MPVPENYYPDLAARFALPAETLKRMQDHGILYDEDTHGRFFQMYTKPFRQRFAFEIVQRQGYRGFGAPNAPCASQCSAAISLNRLSGSAHPSGSGG